MSAENYQQQKFRLFFATKRLEHAHKSTGALLETMKAIVPIAPAAPESDEEVDCQALLDAANVADAMISQLIDARNALDQSIVDMTQVSYIAWTDWYSNCEV